MGTGWNIDDIDVDVAEFSANPKDFFIEVAKGKVAGHEIAQVTSNALGRNLNEESTFWGLQGLYTYLSSAQTMYISSSSVADTTQNILVFGLDGDYNPITGVATLNGQNQVEVINSLGGGAITFLRVFGNTLNSGPDNLQGDVYVAETDTLTGGVPDTFSKIKGHIVAEDNIGRAAIFTVKAGFTAFFWRTGFNCRRADDVELDFYITPFNGPNIKPQKINMYQNYQNVDLPFISFAEKTDVELRIIPKANNTSVASLFQFILIDNTLL